MIDAELHERLQALFDRFKNVPEARFTDDGAVLKRDAYVAFLDARKLIESDVLPAMHRGASSSTSGAPTLRSATEDDVLRALDGAYISPPLSEPAELLEFFNRMVDVMLGETEI